MKCPKCNAENKDTAKFCKNCGESFDSNNVSKPIKEQVNNTSSTTNKDKNDTKHKNVIVICITVIVCLLIVAGAFIYLNMNHDNDNSSPAVNNTTDNNTNTSKVNTSSSKASTSSNVWTYSDAVNYMSWASNTVISNTFDEADSNNDGVLKGSEISEFKHLASLTKRTANSGNTEHVEAQDSGTTGDGTTKTRYCTTHGRVAVGSDNRCPYCEAEGLDSRTVKDSTKYI